MNKTIIYLGSKLQRQDDKIMASQLGDELVMMNFETGDYLGINAIGNKIWNFLKDPIEVGSIIKKLCEQYDIEPSTCEKETLSFLSHLLEEDMIIVH